MGQASSVSAAAQTRMGTGMARNMGWFPAFRVCPTAAGVPVHSTRPRSSTATVSASGNTSSSRCSVRITVVPSSRWMRPTMARKSDAAMGSSWAVGSSRISTSGRRIITAARFSSCFCPPDREAVSRSYQVWMPKKDAISAVRRRMMALSMPRLSAPKASSCHTLSVTI